MKASSLRSTYTHPWLLACLALVLGPFLQACDFNVEITDEKRVLEKIEGTPRCEADLRVAKGGSGSHTFRIYLVDNRKEALNLEGIDQPPFNLKLESFAVPEESVKVLDAETGEESKTVRATVSVDSGSDLTVRPNPRYVELLEASGNKRVPKAIELLIDMGNSARSSDASRTRTSAAATWVLDNFNDDNTRGDLDILAAILLRNGRINADDSMFLSVKAKDYPDRQIEQYLAGDGKERGFLLTTDDAKNKISLDFTQLSPSKADGDVPIYAGIEAAVYELRKVSRENGEALFNPAVIAISLERDVSLVKGQNDTGLKNAETAAKGTEDKDFVPVMSVVYPLPEDLEKDRAKWDKHIDNLCRLAQAGGESRLNYWGNVFYVTPNLRRRYQDDARARLDHAYHAMKGYLEFKFKYSLTGGEAGKRYIIQFVVTGELLGEKINYDASDPDNSLPKLTFEVQN